MKDLVSQLRAALAKYRLTFGDEIGLQNQLDSIFKAEGIEVEREFILSPEDRPDFFTAGYAIEVKVGGSIESHMRQVKRYNNHAAISGSILICTRPYCVPETISGKPFACINVGRNRL